MKTIVIQTWTESEKGWGTRPDGYSLHLSEQDLDKFVELYWKDMPAQVPHEYSRPDASLGQSLSPRTVQVDGRSRVLQGTEWT